MKSEQVLKALFREILREVESNAEFAERLRRAIDPQTRATAHGRDTLSGGSDSARAKNRREAAVLDPIELADQGESVLRHRLSSLSVEQLKDVVADFGMDTDKLALKWKTADRLIERIVQVSLARSKKGDAFM